MEEKKREKLYKGVFFLLSLSIYKKIKKATCQTSVKDQ